MCGNHWCRLAQGTQQVTKKEESIKLQKQPQMCHIGTDNVGPYIKECHNKNHNIQSEWNE